MEIILITKIDMHIHTKYSKDSLIEPKKLPKIIKAKGLQGVAITDHENIFPLQSLPRNDLLIIPGMEISTSCGEIIGIFISEKIKANGSREAVDHIKEQGGLAILPHPFGFPRRRQKQSQDWGMLILRKIDAIETCNARNLLSSQNLLAKRMAEKIGKPMTAGSDAHFLFEIGNGYTIFEDAYSLEDVYHKIKNGKTAVYCRRTSPIVHLMTTMTRISRKLQT